MLSDPDLKNGLKIPYIKCSRKTLPSLNHTQRFRGLSGHTNKELEMTIRTFTVTSLCRNTIWLLLLVACDSFREDFIMPENQFSLSQTEYYILPQTSTIVDLRSGIQQAFT